MITQSTRRDFLKTTAAMTAAMAVSGGSLYAKEPGSSVAIILVPDEASQPAAQWAATELRDALRKQDVTADIFESIKQAPADAECIVAATAGSGTGKAALAAVGLKLPNVPEAVGLTHGKLENRRVLLAAGSDVRGLVYALLELADQVNCSPDPIDDLSEVQRTVETPANRIRSNMRCFVSDVEDKPWFNDREMWPQYLTELATQRFNRFNLSLGIGHDWLNHVRDAYFLFAYPFFLSVPGYDVRVPELPDAERDRNLELLKFISEQTVLRGMEFQLGIWMHGYEWNDSPNANYTIAGLTRETQGAYCRDAVKALLQACPAISGVTFRVHGESGVAEGSNNFWKTVFDGVAQCGRKVEMNLHAKGTDQEMIDMALATGQPVVMAPKYWGEHLGMSYHQADIRELERPRPGHEGGGMMKLSSGSRSFLRYGYGDLLNADRRHGVMHRIWPGTQRLLIWGDPVTGAGYGRAFSFCGSDGFELMEPLTFKGRRGSGIAGDRCAYADPSLRPRWDWEKYLYSLRIWGRLSYNPDSAPDVWQRTLRKQFGRGAKDAELGLASASRILPIITTVHAPNGGNNGYWPEMYRNQSLIDPRQSTRYGDTPAPRVFGNVSPFDPQLFYRINDFADEVLKETQSCKYTPVEVAQWLEDLATTAEERLAAADKLVKNKTTPEYRRLAVDLKIMIGLGRFFGAKFRAGVLYRIHEQAGDQAALEACIKCYQQARDVWAKLSDAAGVYMNDVTVGDMDILHGHWRDRLPDIDQDIAALEKKLAQADRKTASQPRVKALIKEVTSRPQRPSPAARHTQPTVFHAGQPLDLELKLGKSAQTVRLFYRHVNQAERFQVIEMERKGDSYHSVIPAAYTDSEYALQYYFEIQHAPTSSSLYPGFASDLANQPYLVVKRS